MARYFFDFRASGSSSIDEDGLDLSDMSAAHQTAVGALADGIRHIVVEGGKEQQFAIEVRDGLRCNAKR
jgi:hypothetical protein